MTNLERERITVERMEQRGQFVARFVAVLEAPRILQKDSAETIGAGERIEIVAERGYVGIRQRRIVVRKSAKDFRREFEIRIVRHAPHPRLRMRRRRDAVERRVDLDRVEERRQIREVIELRAVRRINGSLPILITPAGWSDADLMFHISMVNTLTNLF